MAAPSRRRDRSTEAEQPRTPAAWEPFAAVPWNADPVAQVRPFNPLAQMRPFNPVAALLDDLLNRWPSIPAGTDRGVSTPLGDLEELDDAWLLQVELPGVKREDVDIQLTGRRLLVRAERKETERKGLLRRSTRTTGRYFLEVMLPSEVDPERVEASLEDGVLTIRVPKPAADQGGTRTIAINQPTT
jgi:HSP20 family protein